MGSEGLFIIMHDAAKVALRMGHDREKTYPNGWEHLHVTTRGRLAKETDA